MNRLVAEQMYRKAEIIDNKAKERQAAMAQWLRDEEKHRQETEMKMLKRSLSVRMQNFQEEWAEKRRVMEEEVTRTLAEASEFCEAEKMHLEHRLSKQRLKPVKYSPEVRDRLIQTAKLCAAHEFQQATYELQLLKVMRRTAYPGCGRLTRRGAAGQAGPRSRAVGPAHAAREGAASVLAVLLYIPHNLLCLSFCPSALVALSCCPTPPPPIDLCVCS